MTAAHSRLAFFGSTLALLSLCLPPTTEAQIRGSERSTVSQTSDGTTVTIDYARPHTRGRTPVFGGLVPWHHTWTPGANEATTFEATSDVHLNGVGVPQGRYSVWMVVREDAPWEVVLDPRDLLYHTQSPGTTDDQIRFEVQPEPAEDTEALTWDFPSVDPQGMALRFRWATTSIPFRVDVPPTVMLTVDAASASPLVGEYTLEMMGPPPEGMPPGVEMPPLSLEVSFTGERLEGVIHGAPPMLPNEMVLVPVAENVFNPAWMMDGAVFETEVDMFFEFDVLDGRAAGFDVRGLEDRLMMRGTRGR